MGKHRAQMIFQCVLSLCWVQESLANTFRVALVSEYTGTHAGGAAKFIEGFHDFVAPYINTNKNGLDIGGTSYQIEVVPFDTKSDAAEVQGIVDKIGNGTNAAGQNVGDFHAIVAGTSQLNTAMYAPAQALGIVNVHTSGGNPLMWKAANTFAFGLHLPFVWYTRDLMKLANQRGMKTIAIIRSNQHGFSKNSCVAALQWAADAGLTVVGPTVNWCNSNGATAGCSVVGQRCVCGDQQTVDDFGYSYNINDVPNFYQVDESAVGNGLVWRQVDQATADFFGTMFDDMLQQGEFPDAVLNFAVEWHNVVKSMKDKNVSPKMLFGWQDGVISEWAKANYSGCDPDDHSTDCVALSGIEGYWAAGFGQWHKAMAFTDPVFGTNANCVSTFATDRGRTLDYDTAGGVAAGVLFYTAMKAYSGDFASLSLAAKRDAVRVAVKDVNQETMWGTIRFNANNQNNGRGTAAWQIIPDGTHTPQQLCVLPLEAAEVAINVPFPTWASRFGCSAGSYNDGTKCVSCQKGYIQPNAQETGMVVNTCTMCGGGHTTDSTGSLVCRPCSAGMKQDGNQDNGLCQDCAIGYYQSNTGSTTCISCSLGTFADRTGLANCSVCPAGKYQDEVSTSKCLDCPRGMYSASGGSSSCSWCEPGKYSHMNETDVTGQSMCSACAGTFTSQQASWTKADCFCPIDTYLAAGTYTEDNGDCRACPDGFSCPGGLRTSARRLETNARRLGTSYDCPGVQCPHNMPILKEGYYAKDEKGQYYSAYHCIEAQTLCKGGTQETYAGQCGGGRQGLQCASCDSGQSSDKGEACVDCTGGPYIWYPLGMVCAVVGLTIIHRVAASPKGGAFAQLPMFSVMSLIVSQAQYVALLQAYELNWPSAFESFLRILQIFLFDMNATSVTCYFGYSLAGLYLPGLFLPLGVCTVMFAMMAFTKVLCKAANSMTFDYVINTLGLVLTGLSVAVFKCILTIFECRPNPSAEDTMASYDGFECMGDDVPPLLPFTIVSIAIFICGGVGAYLYVIILGPSRYHESEAFRKRFQFVLKRWHPTYFFFGAVVLVRNLLMCMVSVVSSEGITQVLLLTIIFAPVFFTTLVVKPWRDIVANWTDGILSAAFLFVMFLAAMCAEDASNSTRNALGWLMVITMIVALVTVVLIIMDMLLLILKGKGVWVKGPQITDSMVTDFLDTFTKFHFLEDHGRDDAIRDVRSFLTQLPQLDVQKLFWLTANVQRGLFGDKSNKLQKKISGIAPVSAASADDRIERINSRRLSQAAEEQVDTATV